MPEGPEIYALSKAIQKCGIQCESYGKHLYIYNRDWSFGLGGRVAYKDGKIIKGESGWIIGKNLRACSIEQVVTGNNLGRDWMNCSDFSDLIEIWKKSRKALGALLLDQSQIAGIGVAWGSEILHSAGNLKPDIPAREQDLGSLNRVIIDIRNHVREIYDLGDKNPIEFINHWFDNLYSIRKMNVYKVGIHAILFFSPFIYIFPFYIYFYTQYKFKK